jgi:hypothetical protein
MAKKQKPPPVLQELSGMLLELKKETDRGLALILVAWLDDALTHVLKLWMVDDEEVLKELFAIARPLSSFSSKINLAYALGMIGSDLRDDFHNARDIRNLFAHDRALIRFSSQNVGAMVRNFKITKGQLGNSPGKVKNERDLFLLTLLVLIGLCMTLGANSQRATWSAHYEASFRTEAIETIAKMVGDMAGNQPH